MMDKDDRDSSAITGLLIAILHIPPPILLGQSVKMLNFWHYYKVKGKKKKQKELTSPERTF